MRVNPDKGVLVCKYPAAQAWVRTQACGAMPELTTHEGQ